MLELVNSGDTAGDKERVVGYGAWSFSGEANPHQDTQRSALERETENLRLLRKPIKVKYGKLFPRTLREAVAEHKHFSPARKDYPDDLLIKGLLCYFEEKWRFARLYRNDWCRISP